MTLAQERPVLALQPPALSVRLSLRMPDAKPTDASPLRRPE